jgi:hypothetical protein
MKGRCIDRTCNRSQGKSQAPIEPAVALVPLPDQHRDSPLAANYRLAA